MADIDEALVRRLLEAQFPQRAELPIVRVRPGGWDNLTFRLGDTMSVRLPRHAAYAPQVAKEHRWLPYLAPHLPLPIPTPLAQGAPSAAFALPWSIYRWLDGAPAFPGPVTDQIAFARDLAHFLAALQTIDARDGPRAGAHSWHRGGDLGVYGGETLSAIDQLAGVIDGAAARALWDRACATSWRRAPVWVHGDVAGGNLLVREGRLSAVIDFGCSAVGDPACDLAIAWTFMDASARAAFRDALPLDDDTWLRGRAWTLWKALIQCANKGAADPNYPHWLGQIETLLDET